jgi:hypothetical protein
MSTALPEIAERPIFGWGPDQGWSAYLHSVYTGTTGAALGRGSDDAHNFILQSMVITGLFGFLSLLAVSIVALPKILHARPHARWAVAGFISLALYSLYEPIASVSTMLFVLAGLAMTGDAPQMRRERESWVAAQRAPRSLGPSQLLVGVGLSLSLVLAGAGFMAATLDRWGTTHDSIEALRLSLMLEPWRVETRVQLADTLAIDPSTADEAIAMSAALVKAHPWDPDSRLSAAWVDMILGDQAGAERWIAQHLELFPADIQAAKEALRPPSAEEPLGQNPP